MLAIDLDQQGNLTTRLGISEDTEVAAVAADVLTGDASAREAAVPAPTGPPRGSGARHSWLDELLTRVTGPAETDED